jgi:hypothetical protein
LGHGSQPMPNWMKLCSISHVSFSQNTSKHDWMHPYKVWVTLCTDYRRDRVWEWCFFANYSFNNGLDVRCSLFLESQ